MHPKTGGPLDLTGSLSARTMCQTKAYMGAKGIIVVCGLYWPQVHATAAKPKSQHGNVLPLTGLSWLPGVLEAMGRNEGTVLPNSAYPPGPRDI